MLALLPWLLALAVVGALLDHLQVRQLADKVYDQALANTALALAGRLESERDNDLALHLGALAAAQGALQAFEFFTGPRLDLVAADRLQPGRQPTRGATCRRTGTGPRRPGLQPPA